ncbi:hypothetical protein Spith_0292 [Spirochaeta thermophila DSM 6578]|uniref:Helicase XPB/Ssl2 N-terminal domain-containing protein n=1 Tax=Winmispira thermophila (strain ATCC 700085 / DSM 6578 / Z-1203) TaxID=869211 RepID=G0GDF2_WINT7|nr:hypothetical protein [Spirochaeta thermophila]AEJ60578.1 hypothetical protein Spith_0292 [Spirochaeta thermophila DSM 6578]
MERRRADIDRLTAYLLTLPDRDFLRLIRNYLGRIETPYHKPQLVERLYRFLESPRIQEAILALLTPQDRAHLSLIAALGEPPPEVFTSFLEEEGEEEPHLVLHRLRDRLLVYLDTGDEPPRIRFTPPLRPLLETHILSLEALLPPEGPTPPSSPPHPWLTDPLLGALLSLLTDDPALLDHKDGIPTSRARTRIASRIPHFSHHPEHLPLLVRALTRLSLIPAPTPAALLTRFRTLADLPPSTRLPLLWAAAITPEGADPHPLAAALLALPDLLPPTHTYTPSTITRALRLALTLHTQPHTPPPIEDLASLGLLVPHETTLSLTPHIPTLLNPPETPPFKVEASGHLIVHPHAVLSDLLVPCAALSLIRHDAVSRYELTKPALRRGLEAGVETAELRLALTVGSGHPLPQPVAATLTLWQEEAERARHLRGIVAILEPEYARIVRQSPQFSTCVWETLGETIFLVREERWEEWKTLLEHAGIGLLGPVEEETPPSEEPLPLPTHLDPPVVPVLPETPTAPPPDLRPALLEALERTPLSEEARHLLKARIEEGYILTPEQLTEETADTELLESDGLDYHGKLRVIEEALSHAGDLVEVCILGHKDHTPLLVRPLALKKKGASHYLEAIPEGEEAPLHIPVRTIQHVRRIPRTLTG